MAGERSWLITADDDPEPYATQTGGGTNVDAEEDYDGGNDEPVVEYGPTKTEDIVIGRAWDMDNGAAHRRNRTRHGQPVTITKQPLDKAGIPTGTPSIFRGIQIGQSEPPVDRNSQRRAKYERTIKGSWI